MHAALLALSVAASAWFALDAVQGHDETCLTLLTRPAIPSTALTAQILRMLNGASTLNPDDLRGQATGVLAQATENELAPPVPQAS